MSSRLPLFCLAGAFGLIGLAPLAMAIGDAPSEGQAAVIFNPGLDRADLMQRIAQTEVSLVRFGALPGSVVVDMPEGSSARLTAAGAWFVADPILLGGCSTESLNISPDRGV